MATLLIVTSGVGGVQAWNGDTHEIRLGDIVWTPPGAKALGRRDADERMSHIAMHESVGGRKVDWMEQVTSNGRAPCNQDATASVTR